MRCPYCASEHLVWDLSTGSVICASCGTVIDVIYDVSAPAYSTTLTRAYNHSVVQAVLYGEKKRLMKKRLSSLTLRTSIYMKLKERIRKGRIVNEKAFVELVQGLRPHVHVVEHELDEQLRRRLSSDLSYLDKYLRIIDNDPILSSRTFRGKIALAMMLHHLDVHGTINLKNIAKELRMSITHLKRLEKLIKERIRKKGITV
ncbi:MAG: hypothetical protein DRO12_00425 [Thermoprotei archaeon]|nr:MAG: hypothetical protein DRO12_00425 [Thermoprotei archaeon]